MAVENSKVLIIVNNWGIEETELTRPLRDVAAIERRLGAVEALTKNTVAREELILSLSGISDMERLIGRIAYGTADATLRRCATPSSASRRSKPSLRRSRRAGCMS